MTADKKDKDFAISEHALEKKSFFSQKDTKSCYITKRTGNRKYMTVGQSVQNTTLAYFTCIHASKVLKDLATK